MEFQEDALLQVVLEIFRDVLRDPALTEDAEFFEAGGSPLLAIDTTSYIAERIGIDLNMSTLFACPTARELCRSVLSGQAAPALKPPEVLTAG
jgi:Phosphopantetheine attachment site